MEKDNTVPMLEHNTSDGLVNKAGQTSPAKWSKSSHQGLFTKTFQAISLIGLRIKEKDTQKAKWIIQRFKVPFKQEQGSVVFRLFDDYNAVDLLFYFKRMGMKAKLTHIL